MARTITVSTQSGLIDALATMPEGGTIYLTGGNYGTLRLTDGKPCDLSFASTMTIAAQDPDNPPVFTGLDLRNSTNLGFEGITFDYDHQDGQPIWTKPFSVMGATNVSFASCTFDGDVAQGLDEASNGFPTGFGLSIRNSTGVSVTESEIVNFYRGLVVSDSDDILVARNDMHTIRMDGMNFSAVQGVVIDENHIHDFARSLNSADHSDMIQFWTNGTTRPSTDITIRNNILDIGDGHYTQSIFMRNDLVDRGIAGTEMFYRNILIEGNVITNAHTHGITVGETAGLTVRSNSVLHADGGAPDGADKSVEIPKILLAGDSTDVVVVQNAAQMISGFTGQSDWLVERNALVQDQDPKAAGWYGDIFTTVSLEAQDGAHLFIARPDGLLASLEAGAPLTLGPDAAFAEAPEQPLSIGMQADPDDAQAIIFTIEGNDDQQPDSSSYYWSFGDGQMAVGETVRHHYADGGSYEATLTIMQPDGTATSLQTSLDVEEPDYLTLQSDGTFIAQTQGEMDIIATGAAPDADGGLQLGGTGVTATLDRDYLKPLFVDDGLSISFALDADTVGTTGELFRLHQSFVADILPSGDLRIRAWSSEGDAVTLQTRGYAVNDTGNHAVELRLQDGQLSLMVDGQSQDKADFAGSFADQGRQDMTFGNPWGGQNFDGDLTDFTVDLNPAPDPFTAQAGQVDTPVI